MAIKFRVTLYNGTMWAVDGGTFDTFDEAQDCLMDNQPEDEDQHEMYWSNSYMEEVVCDI